MKIYLAGKISGDNNYREKFKAAAKKIKEQGFTVMNPAVMPDGFEYEEYMKICFTMIDICQAVCLLPDWRESPGAIREKEKAKRSNKHIFYLHEKNGEYEMRTAP